MGHSIISCIFFIIKNFIDISYNFQYNVCIKYGNEVLIMAQTNINIRIDKNLKQEFEHLCNELGLNMSTAFNIFAKTVVRQQKIPFEISLKLPNMKDPISTNN